MYGRSRPAAPSVSPVPNVRPSARPYIASPANNARPGAGNAGPARSRAFPVPRHAPLPGVTEGSRPSSYVSPTFNALTGLQYMGQDRKSPFKVQKSAGDGTASVSFCAHDQTELSPAFFSNYRALFIPAGYRNFHVLCRKLALRETDKIAKEELTHGVYSA